MVSKYHGAVSHADCKEARRKQLQRIYNQKSDLEACRSCMSEWMMIMMMKWCPLSRGQAKARLARRRGDLLSLADFGVEGTLEERESKVREIFNILWTENQRFRSLPACRPSFLPFFMSTSLCSLMFMISPI